MSAELGPIVFIVFFVIGLAIAIYGWLNRYKMIIYYPGGKIELRGSSNVYDLMVQLREALLKMPTRAR